MQYADHLYKKSCIEADNNNESLLNEIFPDSASPSICRSLHE